MASRKLEILPLPAEVQAQIKSSIAITSLSDVVIELIKNSLDAQAQVVRIDVGYRSGHCSIEDDADGIPAAEFAENGHLGSLYCTSKHKPSPDTYGSHGRFLSSLCAQSLLSITTRHRAEVDECTLSFHGSQVIARFRTSHDHQRVLHKIHGTKVTVRDLFGKMPVRVKHRAIQYGLQEDLDRELEELKRKVVALLLAWSRPVKVLLSDTAKKRRCHLRLTQQPLLYHVRDGEIGATAKMPFRLDWICPLLAQAGFIAYSSFASWVTASARTSTTSIRAAISLEPAPTKQIQFLSFGIWPIDSRRGSRILFDEVNRLFALSSFGASEGDPSDEEKLRRQKDKRHQTDESSTRQVKGIAKGADRWPMFYIRVDSSSQQEMSDENQAQDSDGRAARVLQKVLQLVKTLIHQFLEEHHFRPRVRRSKKRKEANHMSHQRSSFSDSVTQPLSKDVSSQSLARTDATLKVSKSRQYLTAQGFDSWSRVKSGKREGLEHILSGLPRRKSLQENLRPVTAPAAFEYGVNAKVDIGRITLADSQLESTLDGDVQLLLHDMHSEDLISDSDGEEAECGDGRPVLSTMDVPIRKDDEISLRNKLTTDESILWTDPTTGRLVRINSRTGLMMPDLEGLNNHKTSEEGNSFATSKTIASVSETEPFGSFRQTRKLLRSEMHLPSDSWIVDLLKSTEKPIFRQPEEVIASINPDEALTNGEVASCCHSKFDYGRLKQESSVFDVISRACKGRLSKSGLADAQAIAQVDRKFILVKFMNRQSQASVGDKSGEPFPKEPLLVLIDQHAADERCQVEALYEELCDLEIVQLLKPLHFEVPAQEIRLFQRQKDLFAGWGFCYDTQIGCEYGAPPLAARRPDGRFAMQRSEDSSRIVVTALPKLIAERCRLDPRILIDLLRTEIWARDEAGPAKSKFGVEREELEPGQMDRKSSGRSEKRWLSRISGCPKGLLEMLNSRACRSAIMFNDVLSIEECRALVKRLAKCSFPFQCAHGRPSMVALGGLGILGTGLWRPFGLVDEQQEGGGDFSKAFDSWQAGT